MEDKQIISLLFARAEEALDTLAAKFGRGLLRQAKNILRSPEDAEEAVSDTYLALWNAIPPASPDPLAPYVYRTGRNTALKRLRHESAKKRSSYEVSLDELSEAIAGPNLEDAVSARDLGQAIDRWLDTQSKENRIIFLRRYWFGDPIKDIAGLTGLTVNTVSVRLSRLRSKLADHLTKEGYYERKPERSAE